MLMRKPCYLADAYEKARTGDGRHPTRIAKDCQRLSLQSEKHEGRAAFGERLRIAFKGASNAEITRKLGLKSQSVLTKWMAGTLPTGDALVNIARIAKVNIHWLLTGEGEADVDPLRFLDEKVRRLVERLAAADKTTVEKVIEVLITDGLVRRGSYLFALYPKLRGHELDELRLLFELIQEGAEESESQNAKDRTG